MSHKHDMPPAGPPHSEPGLPDQTVPDRVMEDAGSQALAEALRSSFKIVKFLMVLLVAAFFVSGIFTVNPNEIALVLRFGKPTGSGSEQILKPGLHWAFPYPIDEIVRIPVGQSHTILSSAGWYAVTPEMEAAGQLPPVMPFLRAGVDGYTLTGDGNLIHARVTLKYRLQPERAPAYVFNFYDATNLLQNILNNAILYASAQFTADDAIFGNKPAFDEMVIQRARQVMEEQGLGITADAFEVQTSPPLDVRADFDEVLNAQQTADTRIREADAYASSTTNSAIGHASFLTSDGATRSNQVVKTMAAEASYFSSQLPYYQKEPELFKQRLLLGTMEKVLTNAQEKFFVPQRASGKPWEIRMQLSREPQKPSTKDTTQP